MDMWICSEVAFKSGLWYSKAMEGIRKAASRKGINLRETDENAILGHAAARLFGDEKRFLTIIGASDRLMERLIRACRAEKIHMLFFYSSQMKEMKTFQKWILKYGNKCQKYLIKRYKT